MHIADDLYARGAETMPASWSAYADGAVGAVVHRLSGVTTAVFPHPPERESYNNALFGRDLSGPDRAGALDAMEASYATAGIARFAAWVHERDRAMCGDLERRGYLVDTSTRAMAMVLDGAQLPEVDTELGAPDWSEYIRALGVPGLLASADPDAFHVLAARAAKGPDRRPAAGRARPWLPHGELAGDPDGRAAVRRRRLPRPRPDHRVRAPRVRSEPGGAR